MAVGDFANQRRVATAESRAGELGAALEEAKRILESGDENIPEVPEGKIVAIGHVDDELVGASEVRSTSIRPIARHVAP
jgi:hypothetical protein